jgi:hypothetical protein
VAEGDKPDTRGGNAEAVSPPGPSATAPTSATPPKIVPPVPPVVPAPPPPRPKRNRFIGALHVYGQRLGIWLNRGFLGYLVGVILGSGALLVAAKPHLVHYVWAAFVAVAVVTFAPPIVVKFRREVVAYQHERVAQLLASQPPASRVGGPFAAASALVGALLAVMERVWTILVGLVVGGLAYGVAELTTPMVATVIFGAAAVGGAALAIRSAAKQHRT